MTMIRLCCCPGVLNAYGLVGGDANDAPRKHRYPDADNHQQQSPAWQTGAPGGTTLQTAANYPQRESIWTLEQLFCFPYPSPVVA